MSGLTELKEKWKGGGLMLQEGERFINLLIEENERLDNELGRSEGDNGDYIERLELMLRRCGVPYSVMRDFKEPVNWVAIRDREMLNTAETVLGNFLQSEVKISDQDDGFRLTIDNSSTENEAIFQAALGSDLLLRNISTDRPIELVLSVIDRYNESAEELSINKQSGD